MLRVHRFEQDCQYIEDTKHHKLYHIPAEQCGIFQVLHGALFAGTALCGAALGLSLPLWLAVSAGCMLAVLLKLYEHRVFLPRLSCVKRLPKQTYQNPVVVTLALTVTGTSAFQFIRQLRILRKRRML